MSGDPPWKRESAGRYRSSDGRFVIGSEGGRWFLRDETELDEFGMPRTSGPFGTLAAARDAAKERRTHPSDRSPLERRVRQAKRSSGGKVRTPTRATAQPEPPDEQTWLERLDSDDPARARTTRGWIADLRRLGVEDAEDLVRREVETDRPRIAARLLAMAVERRIVDDLTPSALRDAARRARVDSEDPVAYAAFVVARTIEAMLDELSLSDRLPDASARLPGWSLVERVGSSPPGRAIHLTADELAGTRRSDGKA